MATIADLWLNPNIEADNTIHLFVNKKLGNLFHIHYFFMGQDASQPTMITPNCVSETDHETMAVRRINSKKVAALIVQLCPILPSTIIESFPLEVSEEDARLHLPIFLESEVL